ncbi:MAG TPA: penicillin-binding protein activator [Candidatus Acidoferrales bacterium]|nr:penicillin-binding protein activator [Candidatus Acidoferrales bacterium]
MGRSRALWGIVAGGTILLTACGGGGTASGNHSPIRVGYEVPLSGAFAANGKNEENGWLLGLKDFGDTVDGHKIQTTFVDTQADPNVALSQVRELVDNQHIQMLEGPLAANEIAAVAGYTAPKGIPTDDLALCSAIQLQYYVKYGVGLSSGWSCNQPAIMAAVYAYNDLHWRKVMTIGQDFAFGWLVTGGFGDEFKKLGGTVVKMLWAPNTTTDFSPYVSQIPKSGIDGVYAELSGATAVRFTAAYKSFGLTGTVPLLGITQLTDYSVLPSEDPNAVLGLKTGAQYCDGIPTPKNQKFANEYYAQYGTYPGYYSDAGYTKARLLISALQTLHGDASNGKNLIKAMKSTSIVSSRGPVKLSGAPAFAPIQNIYICQVQRVNGVLHNVPIKTYTNVQPWGDLSESEWEAGFRKYSAARPTA